MRTLRSLSLLLVVSCASGGTGSSPDFERFDLSRAPGPDAYPDAPGVVLLDKGELIFTVDRDTQRPLARLRRYTRTKILRDTGLELARVDIQVEPGSLLQGLVARHITPEGESIRVPDDRIVDITNELGLPTRSFRVEGVAPGSIVEHTYDVFYRDLRLVPAWKFQSKIPTLRSELAVVVPPAFSVDYRFIDQGLPANRPPERFAVDEGTRLFWTLGDVPATFDEPDMPSVGLSSPQVHVVFTGGKIDGTREVGGFEGWEDARDWFFERSKHGLEISEAQRLEARHLAGETSMEEQALKLQALVARDLGWEPHDRPLIWARTPTASVVLTEKRGNRTSRGLLLVALLRGAGIDALPAFAADRTQATILPDLATLRVVDRIVAVIPRPNGALVLDPGQLTVNAAVPAPRLMGTRVVTLRDDSTEVLEVPIALPAHSLTQLTYVLRVDRAGHLSGKLEGRLTGAEAGTVRELLLMRDPSEYSDLVIEFLKERGASIPVSSVNIADLKELRKPVLLSATIDVEDVFTDPTDRSASIVLERILGSEPPPARERRRTPLVLPYPRRAEINVTLFIPDDHQVGTLPAPFSAKWANGSVEITSRSESKKRIGLSRISEVTGLLVRPADYPEYFKFLKNAADAERTRLDLTRPPPKQLQY
ncbi:MAG: DUF3857 domain-containing protein [Deltaproteobacteria bacterium]|nr:DUF3857 domain-containing protein [Deltaproteobacteria bacterium]